MAKHFYCFRVEPHLLFEAGEAFFFGLKCRTITLLLCKIKYALHISNSLIIRIFATVYY